MPDKLPQTDMIARRLTVERHQDVRAIETEWRSLDADGIGTVFQRFDWVDAYVRHVAPHEGLEPAFLLGRLDGRAGFVLPLGIVRQGPLRIARWLGGSHSGYNFGLWSGEMADAVGQLGRGALERMLKEALPGVDGAILARMPLVHDGVAQPLAALVTLPSDIKGYSFSLEGGFEAVLKRSDGAARRRRVRTKERRLAATGPLHIGKVTDPAEAAAALDFFFEHKALRLAEQGKANSFTERGVRDFFHDLLAQSHAMDAPLLEMTALSVDGKLRAVWGAGIHRARMNTYFMTFARDDVVSHSPGQVLLFRHIEECSMRGLAAYDLGVGYEAYKTHWCDVLHELVDGYAAFTAKGALGLGAIRLGQRTKGRLQRSDRLWKALKALRRRGGTQTAGQNTGGSES